VMGHGWHVKSRCLEAEAFLRIAEESLRGEPWFSHTEPQPGLFDSLEHGRGARDT